MATIAPFFVSRALRFASHVGKTGPEAAQVKDGLARHKKTGCDRLPVPLWTAGVQAFPQLSLKVQSGTPALKGGRQDAAAGRVDAVDPCPMLIRMVHVRPSLGPIPQPRQPRTLIRVP